MTDPKELRSQFTHLLFESDIGDALQLLCQILTEGEDYDLVVECITAWQDLIDSSGSPLSPLLECLHEEDARTVSAALTVVNGLDATSPDPTRRFRMINELKDLKFENQLSQLRLRWESCTSIQGEIDVWYNRRREERESTPKRERAAEQTEDSQMLDVNPIISDLLDVLKEAQSEDERKKVVQNFITNLLKKTEECDGSVDLEHQARDVKDQPCQSLPPLAPPLTAPAPPPPLLAPPPPQAPPPPITVRAPGGPPPPPPPSFGKGCPPPPPSLSRAAAAVVELPVAMKPKRAPSTSVRMKTLMWSKIAPNCVVGQVSNSVWAQLATESKGLSLDFDMIEGMFSLSSSSPSKKNEAQTNTIFKKKDAVVDLLTPKRSQNVTITLKRFKDLEAVLCDLRENRAEHFDVETLRSLKAILPDVEEKDALHRYSGDVSLLAPACSFFLQVISIPEYSLRIDCMTYQLEFHRCMEKAVPNLSILLQACKEISDSSALRRLLLLLVNIGNYLNGSSAHGNAAGFKLNSLWKIIDLKAAKGGATLLHAVARMDPLMLDNLQSDLPTLKKASEISIEEIKTSLRQLEEQSKVLLKQIKTSSDENLHHITLYLENHCGPELATSGRTLTSLMQRQDELAVYFCENKNTFKLEECLKIFANFIGRLQQAVQENKERDERAARQTRQCASEESVQVVRETPTEGLFATLERGSTLKQNRRKSSLRNLEITREREQVGEEKIRRLREELEKEKVEESTEKQSEEITESTMTETSSTPKTSRRPRRSIHYENTSNLSDYIESLQQATIPPRSPLSARPRPLPEEEPISVAIPTEESDGCPSSGSSPKSGSDEGFESEKDREIVKVEEEIHSESENQPPAEQNETKADPVKIVPIEKPEPETVPVAVKNVPRTSLLRPKAPRLVSVTTTAQQARNTGHPTAVAAAQAPPRSTAAQPSPDIKKRSVLRAPLQKQRTITPIKHAALTSAARPSPTVSTPGEPRAPSGTKPAPRPVPGMSTGPRPSSSAGPPRATTPRLTRPGASRLSAAASKTMLSDKPAVRSIAEKKERVTTPIGPAMAKLAPKSTTTSTRGAALSRKPLVTAPAVAKPSPAVRKPAPRTPLVNCKSTISAPSVSTSSRPALIKTGSLSQRHSLRAMAAVEKPRPLKKTAAPEPPPPAKPAKARTGKPQWV